MTVFKNGNTGLDRISEIELDFDVFFIKKASKARDLGLWLLQKTIGRSGN